jgi:hypothetical protein
MPTDATDVRFGSLADVLTSPRHVRFYPDNGHWAAHPRQYWLSVYELGSAAYALPSDLRGAHTLNASPVRSSSEGSSFSGLFTLVEIGHIVIGSEG